MKLILASGSPRRREILEGLGWSFEIRPSEIEEGAYEGEEPGDLVRRLARSKAEAVEEPGSGALVLAADTVVVIDGAILGKPEDRGEALAMLERLNGRTHRVYTGICLIAPDGARAVIAEQTQVTFRSMDRKALAAYVASGEGDDKAGAYAVQGRGALLVERIQGDYWNVVGLPVVAMSRLLESLGWPLAEQWGEIG
jgi:septum formation protein